MSSNLLKEVKRFLTPSSSELFEELREKLGRGSGRTVFTGNKALTGILMWPLGTSRDLAGRASEAPALLF